MAITVTKEPSSSPDLCLYSVKIDDNPAIKTTVTSDSYVCNTWIKNVISARKTHYQSHQLIIGISIEFHRFSPYRLAATLQLCCGTYCLIYQLCHSKQTPTRLVNFLLDPYVTLVDICHINAYRLRLLLPFHKPLSLREISDVCHGISFDDVSVANIASEFLGMHVNDSDMGAYMSNWEAVELNLDQIKHATLDALVPFNFGVKIDAWKLNHNLYTGRL